MWEQAGIECSRVAWKSFVPVLTEFCDRQCSFAAGNNYMQVWKNLCNRKCFCEITLLAGILFWRNSILPAKIWTGMCRALLCGDDSSHSQSQSGKRLLLASRGHPMRTHPFRATPSDPKDQSHTLDPAPKVPLPILPVPIRLLKKDSDTECLTYAVGG